MVKWWGSSGDLGQERLERTHVGQLHILGRAEVGEVGEAGLGTCVLLGGARLCVCAAGMQWAGLRVGVQLAAHSTAH